MLTDAAAAAAVECDAFCTSGCSTQGAGKCDSACATGYSLNTTDYTCMGLSSVSQIFYYLTLLIFLAVDYRIFVLSVL